MGAIPGRALGGGKTARWDEVVDGMGVFRNERSLCDGESTGQVVPAPFETPILIKW